MITYEYQCYECDNTWDEEREMVDRNNPSPCPECGSTETGRDFTGGVRVEVFEPMVYDHIGPDPILITSKRQLKEECNKAGVVACRCM